jgi:hypothetical protein
VFLICAAINIVGGTICIILLDANVQPWARVAEKADEKDQKKSGEALDTPVQTLDPANNSKL